MVGITSYGAYIPYYRLSQAEIARAWGGRSAKGERSVANFDEDAATMGVAAAQDCLKGVDRSTIDGIYFASTTAPYKEKQSSVLIATALDLRRQILTADFTDTLRAGTIALSTAAGVVKGDPTKKILVIASDCRKGYPAGSFEQVFGDGAAAFLIGAYDVVASIEGSYTHSDEFTDLWRQDRDVFVKSWEDRFIVTEGYLSNIREAFSEFTKQYSLSPKDFSKIALYGPDPRSHLAACRALKLDYERQVQNPMFDRIGNTGCAFALMILVAALQEAKAGDRLLAVSYGSGCDIIALAVAQEIAQLKDRRGIKHYLAEKTISLNYESYLRIRNIIETQPPARPPFFTSVPAEWRSRKGLVNLYGARCRNCGTVQFPWPRICTVCKTKDNFEEVRLSDKPGELLTYVVDYLAVSPRPPTVVGVVELEGGCRWYGVVIDCEPEEVSVGMPVEPTFRVISEETGFRNYYWKVKPIR